MLGNLDIWRVILSHFEINFKTAHSDAAAMRMTMLHVSLLSSDFVELGLDALWRTIHTLHPIVNILNNSAPPNNESIQHRPPAWILRGSIEERSIHRAKSYLSRIRHFYLRVDGENPEEISLGLLLARIFGNNIFLLPNLRKLGIWAGGDVFRPCLTQIHPTFTSPTLEHISYNDISSASSPIVTHIQHLFKLQSSVSLTSVTFRGSVLSEGLANELVDGSSCLENLQALEMTFCSQARRSVYPVKYLLSRLPRLKSLSLGLDIFAPSSTTTSDNTPNSNSSLQELRLHGSYNAISSLLNQLTAANLTTLTLSIQRLSKGNSWKSLMDQASLAFPSTKSLSLHCVEPSSRLAYEHLSAFLAHKHLTSFSLFSVPHSFTMNDFSNFTVSWPFLETFELCSQLSRNTFPLRTLIDFSALRYLRQLTLPLDLQKDSLSTSAIENTQFNQINNCPLRTLGISSPSPDNEPSVRQKIMLANYFLFLFPSLRYLDDIRNGEPSDLCADLQELITAYRSYHARTS